MAEIVTDFHDRVVGLDKDRNFVVKNALIVESGATLSAMGAISFADGGSMSFLGTTGTKIGLNYTQKLAFWGAVPVTQPTVLAAITTTQPTATVFGFTTTAQFNNLIAAVNTIIANMKSIGMMATA
jgi:hypothetical protein